MDATLATADGKTIKCHKILLSAGSGLLEELLAANPSDHPTVVLSRIRHADLRLIVDFMYSGEVAVEHARLPGLLEAARLLRIKGLWDSEQQQGSYGRDLRSHKENFSCSWVFVFSRR